MGISIAVSAAVVLFFAMVMWVKSALSAQDRSFATSESLNREGEFESGCPAEFVTQIFAKKDLEYVSALGSPQQIIRTHLRASRGSQDLEFATEAGILLRYGVLQFLCGVLFVSIELAGPQSLQGLAARADAWAQRIREAQLGFQSAKETGRVHGV
jgi:hypothetical protein